MSFCNTTTCQLIKLENCSNILKMQEVFQLKFFKKLKSFVCCFSGEFRGGNFPQLINDFLAITFKPQMLDDQCEYFQKRFLYQQIKLGSFLR